MGVAYINNCIPKEIRNWKSLYFVVREEIIIPKPNPSAAIMKSSSGNIKIYVLGLMLEPKYR